MGGAGGKQARSLKGRPTKINYADKDLEGCRAILTENLK
jgi:hypothetical protein